MSSMNEPKLSVHQLIQFLGNENADRRSVAASSSSAIRSHTTTCANSANANCSGNSAAVMQTPKSSTKRGVPARRILFSSSPTADANGNTTTVNSAPLADKGKPSTKRSSSVMVPALSVLCGTPKSSTAAARSSSTNARTLMDQLQSGNLPVSHSVSPMPSPVVQGKKVTVSELFCASTSATFTPKSTKMLTPFFKVKHDSESSANIEVSAIMSPNATGSPVANAFVTPTNRQHLRRQQSASATLVGGRYGGNAFLRASSSSACGISRRFTPPPGKEISSPIFAASKYVESPSASSLPLPPIDWIQDAVKAKHASIAEDVLEDDEESSTLRPLFFLNTAAAADEEESDDTGKSSMTDDASSTASSGAIFDMEDVHTEKTALPPSAAADSMDSGEGSLSSVSDNECDSVPTPSTPTVGKLAGVRMNPFSLIAAVASPQV